MYDSSNGARVPQRPADPWQELADAHLDHDRPAAVRAFGRLRARFWLPFDAAMLALDAKREMESASSAQSAQVTR